MGAGMRVIVGTSLACTLGACSAVNASDNWSDFKAQAVGHSPLVREIAASNTFYRCSEHPDADAYDGLCEACDVGLYADKDLPATADPDQDAPIVGLKVFATHFYHEYKPWGDNPNPRISSTGERGTKTFRTSEVNALAARDLFEQANAWCQERRKGEFLVLKDEIDTYFAGEAS